jgi:hypothetical protein
MSEEKGYKDEFEYADEIFPTTTFWEEEQEEKLQEIVNAGGSSDFIDILFTGQYRTLFNFMVNKDTNHIQLFAIYQSILDFLLFWLLEHKLIFDDMYLEKTADAIFKGKEVTDAYRKEKSKVDFIFREYLEKIDNIHTDSNNQNEIELFAINEFPENVTNEQKKILNKLAGGYLIHPKLLQNNKYKPFKERDIKDVIRKLYTVVPGYTHDNAFAFMTLFIDTSKEGSVIQNYCREIRKDIPTKKRNA